MQGGPGPGRVWLGAGHDPSASPPAVPWAAPSAHSPLPLSKLVPVARPSLASLVRDLGHGEWGTLCPPKPLPPCVPLLSQPPHWRPQEGTRAPPPQATRVSPLRPGRCLQLKQRHPPSQPPQPLTPAWGDQGERWGGSSAKPRAAGAGASLAPLLSRLITQQAAGRVPPMLRPPHHTMPTPPRGQGPQGEKLNNGPWAPTSTCPVPPSTG